jgi:hypothetical protein
MSTQEDLYYLFKASIDSLSLSQGGIAKWMYHEDTKQNRKYVSRKYTGNSSIRTYDATLMQLLSFMESEGYDIKNIEFSEKGKLKNIKKVGD